MRLFVYVGAYVDAYVGEYPLENNFINDDLYLFFGRDAGKQLIRVLYIDIKRPLVIRALRRSNVRKKLMNIFSILTLVVIITLR